MTQEEIENLKSPICFNKTELIINFQTKTHTHSLSPNVSPVHHIQIYRRNTNSIQTNSRKRRKHYKIIFENRFTLPKSDKVLQVKLERGPYTSQ